jgi:hypothetical protein
MVSDPASRGGGWVSVTVRPRGLLVRAAAASISLAPGPSGLLATGMDLPVLLQAPNGISVLTRAQVDTGSSISSVDQSLISQLGAPPSGTPLPVEDISGTVNLQAYLLRFATTAGVAISDGFIPVLADTLPAPQQALIGRDILISYLVRYNGSQGSWSMQPAGTLPAWFWPTVGALAATAVGLGIDLVRHR